MMVEDFNEYRRKMVLANDNIRKNENNYEYCVVKNYETLFEFEEAHAVQLENVFANFLEVDNRLVFVSILFPMARFDVDDIISWTGNYAVHFDSKGAVAGKISGAKEIISGLKFRGYPVIMYQKGRSSIDYDSADFVEVTEDYIYYHEVNSFLAIKPITADEPELEIYLNGEQIYEIPRIEFEQENLIVCNGTFLVADYMDDYFGCIGFFDLRDETLPVAWIQDKNTIVHIDLQENDEFGQVCILKFAYELDIDGL